MLFIVLPSRHFKCTLSPLSLIIQQQKRWRGEILADLAPSLTTPSTPVHIPDPGEIYIICIQGPGESCDGIYASYLLSFDFISNLCQTKRQEPKVWRPWGWWWAGGQNGQWSWQVGFLDVNYLNCFCVNIRWNSGERNIFTVNNSNHLYLLQSESFWEQLCDNSKGTAASGNHCFSSGRILSFTPTGALYVMVCC